MLNDTNRCGAAGLERKLFSGVRDAAAGSLPRNDGVILKHTFAFAAGTPNSCPHKVRAARTHRRGCATAPGLAGGRRGCAARPRHLARALTGWWAPIGELSVKGACGLQSAVSRPLCQAVHLKPCGALGRHP